MTQDQGNRFVRSSVPESAPLIMIHHWGAPKTVIVDGGAQGDHMVGHDMTVPPFHGEQVRAAKRREGPRVGCGPAMGAFTHVRGADSAQGSADGACGTGGI